MFWDEREDEWQKMMLARQMAGQTTYAPLVDQAQATAQAPYTPLVAREAPLNAKPLSLFDQAQQDQAAARAEGGTYLGGLLSSGLQNVISQTQKANDQGYSWVSNLAAPPPPVKAPTIQESVQQAMRNTGSAMPIQATDTPAFTDFAGGRTYNRNYFNPIMTAPNSQPEQLPSWYQGMTLNDGTTNMPQRNLPPLFQQGWGRNPAEGDATFNNQVMNPQFYQKSGRELMAGLMNKLAQDPVDARNRVLPGFPGTRFSPPGEDTYIGANPYYNTAFRTISDMIEQENRAGIADREMANRLALQQLAGQTDLEKARIAAAAATGKGNLTNEMKIAFDPGTPATIRDMMQADLQRRGAVTPEATKRIGAEALFYKNNQPLTHVTETDLPGILDVAASQGTSIPDLYKELASRGVPGEMVRRLMIDTVMERQAKGVTKLPSGTPFPRELLDTSYAKNKEAWNLFNPADVARSIMSDFAGHKEYGLLTPQEMQRLDVLSRLYPYLND